MNASEDKMSFATVDIQGFHIKPRCGNGNPLLRYIVKELAIRKNDQSLHFVFKPPPNITLSAADLRTVRYTENYHGIKFNFGYVGYNMLDEIIISHLTDVKIIYLRGRMKQKFFINKFVELAIENPPKIITLEDLDTSKQWSDCPRIVENKPKCLCHFTSRGRCAVTNVEIEEKWLISQLPQ